MDVKEIMLAMRENYFALEITDCFNIDKTLSLPLHKCGNKYK